MADAVWGLDSVVSAITSTIAFMLDTKDQEIQEESSNGK